VDRRSLIGAGRVLLAGVLGSRVTAAAAADEDADLAAFRAAISLNSARDIRALLLRGADPNRVGARDGPAIVSAAAARSWQAMQALLEARITQVDLPNARSETALMFAALHGELDAARQLMQRGAQVNRPGWAPLHYAATGGHVAMVRWLLEQSAYIDAHSPNRTTPLMMAARHRRLQVLELLVEEGADPSQRNDNGWSAADYAERSGEATAAAWLHDQALAFGARYRTVSQ
jgi:ankyrin repeat protein